MIVLPINPNIIKIPVIQTGCLRAEFDSTYPIQLNGIIQENEFKESIANINRSITSRTPLLICASICIVLLLGGMTIFIVGGITSVSSRRVGFPIIIGVGFGIFFLGMISMVVGCFLIQSRRTIQLRKLIENESMKYSTRSPIACRWRLDCTRLFYGGYRNRSTIVYQILIEIQRPTNQAYDNVSFQFNQTSAQPTAYFSAQDSMAPPPPPYDDQSCIRYCSHCGQPRENSTAKFCSSCGHQFNK